MIDIAYSTEAMTSQKTFFGFQCFGYHVSVEHDEKIHSPNWMGIGSWRPEIRPHEYLISPIEISVNWPGSKQLWTRPIYTDFSGANYAFMRPYLGLPWTNSCQIWCVRIFHHVLLKYCHENAEMQKWKFDDVTLQYSICDVMKGSESHVGKIHFSFFNTGCLCMKMFYFGTNPIQIIHLVAKVWTILLIFKQSKM